MRGISLKVWAWIVLGALAAAAPKSLAATLAAGDFNGDGFLDLAISVTAEDVDGHPGAGVVQIIYGSAGRLASDGNQLWSQAKPHIANNPADDEHFGSALAVGDFNGDGFDDLVIAVSDEVLMHTGRGAVHIIYGTAMGLSATGNQFFGQMDIGASVSLQSDFAKSLAVGDFNGDGFSDLAIGEPNKGAGGANNAGLVHIIYGSAMELDATTAQHWSQDTLMIANNSQDGDHFGEALAAGDFDGDGFDDLAIGVPGQKVGHHHRAGAVVVMYGTMTGLDSANVQNWDRRSPNIVTDAGDDDHFGAALATGDFNGDGLSDLAIGVPGAMINTIPSAGAVHVLYGTAMRLSDLGSQFFSQNVPQVPEDAEPLDGFGTTLTTGDFNGDGRSDLAVGLKGEDITIMHAPYNAAGAVHVFYGSITGLQANGSQLWSMHTPEIKGVPGSNRFGYALAAGDFDNDGHDDLAISSPYEMVDMIPAAGAVHVLYGMGSGLNIANNQLWHQDKPDIMNKCEANDHFGR